MHTVNDRRQQFGLPPISGGDRLPTITEFPLPLIDAVCDTLTISLARSRITLPQDVIWESAVDVLRALKASGVLASADEP